MRKIRDILRLKLDAKLSHERIAAALGISKDVVTKYVGLAAAASLDWPAVQSCDEVTLERRLLVGSRKLRGHVQPNFGRFHQELRRKGMTLMLLWEEYRADYASSQTYGYSQFCDNYRRFAKQLKRSMRQIHRAGEKLFIDFAGPTLALTDGSRAHIFVAAMGASSYTFACATPRETMADWLESTARALSFYGGVTQLIVPDNPRALISDANRYEPRSNDTVLDFARHYGTSILPARPYHPQDKAKVESAVQIVERWIMARLRHQPFASVHEVNAAIAPLLKQLNERPFQKLPGSRASTFAALDVPALLPLPLQRYEMARFKTVKAYIDYHVEVEGHRYSVPHALAGQELEARITTGAIEILHRGQRVTSHVRNSRRGSFSTIPEHMPAAHRAHMEWTPQRLIHWGQSIGPATALAVTRLMEENKHPEHGYRACLGLLSLANYISKTAERKPGSYPAELAQVCNLAALPKDALNAVLGATAVGEVWGVGRRIAKQLEDGGIRTVLELALLDPATVRSRWSVVLERTVRELRGMPCVQMEDVPAPKKEIAYTRSFGCPVTRLEPLIEAVSEYASRAAEKLRKQNSVAAQVLVFAHTSPYRPGPKYHRSVVVPLRRPSADTALIVHAAVAGMHQIYQPGFDMIKAGVMLLDLGPDHLVQGELDLGDDGAEVDERSQLMKVMDGLNNRYGRGTVHVASSGLDDAYREWGARQERRTPHYTTKISDFPIARA